MWPDGYAGRQFRRADDAGMDPAEAGAGRVEQGRDACVVGVRITRDNARTGKTIGGIRRQNHRSGLATLQLRFVFTIGEKTDVSRPRTRQGGHPGNACLRVPMHIAAQAGGDFGERPRLRARCRHYLPSDKALMTRSVISRRGLTHTTSCRIRSNLSLSAICLMARLARSITAAFSSFWRRLRSSRNSR